MTASLVLLTIGALTGVALRGRVHDAAFRGLYRGFTASVTLVRGFLAGWVFTASANALVALGVAAVAEIACSRLLARVAGPRTGPVAGFAAHSNTTYWSLPAAALTAGAAGVALVTVYDMLAAPRVGPALRRLQRSAPVAGPRLGHAVDLTPVFVGALGLGAGAVVAAPPWAEPLLVPLAVVAGAVGAAFFGLSLHLAWPARPVVRAAAVVVAVRTAVLPVPLALASAAGLEVPATTWLLVTGLAPFNTVVLSRLYGYPTPFATAVVALSVIPTAATAAALLAR